MSARSLIAISTLLLGCKFLLHAQQPADLNEGSRLEWDSANEIYRFSWWGTAGQTYFIQHSEDLVDWNYVPIIEPGADAVVEWGFTSDADRFFLRLKWVGGDGVDPYTRDSDNDGIPDAWEVTRGFDPFDSADALLDLDEDDYSNLQEWQNGTDPADPAPMIELVVPMGAIAL